VQRTVVTYVCSGRSSTVTREKIDERIWDNRRIIVDEIALDVERNSARMI